MSSSMISSVLEIEREAEALLSRAEEKAKQAVLDAQATREAEGKAYFDAVKAEIQQIEDRAAREREQKVGELAARGEADLSAVRNVSDAAFDNGVQYLMKALSGGKEERS